MPTYLISFYRFGQITANSGNPLSTTSTTGATGSFTVNPGATPVKITVDDDDDVFHDAFIDPGTSQTLLTDTTIGGTVFPAGSVVELEFTVSTSSGSDFFYIRVNGTNVGIGGTTLPVPGTTYTITGSSDGQLEPFENVACFTEGTMILTPDGEVPVEHLLVGDMVTTFGNGSQAIRWIGKRDVTVGELRIAPSLSPILFRAGAMGNAADLRVSPQHRMLVQGWQAELLFGEEAVLVPAKALVNDTDILQVDPDETVTYHHLLLDRHEVVFANGAPSESLFLGDRTDDQFTADQCAEIDALFPHLAYCDRDAMQAVFPILRVGEGLAVSTRR